jgi:formate hydrogenlyase transcriptional activator
VDHCLERLRRRINKSVARVAPETLKSLTGYAWPGNVRELENIVERALIVSQGDSLQIDPSWLAGPVSCEPAAGSLADQERQAILEALRQAHGKVYGASGAATKLGLKPTTLYGKMRKLGIRKTAIAE